MSPVTHFLTSWVIANSARLERRDRAMVTLAGIAPDLDGLGAIAEVATADSETPLLWFSRYHHSLLHNIGFGILILLLSLLLAIRKRTTAFLVVLAFHIHLLADLAGGRGPDGHQWPIPYLLPFSGAWNLTWSGQWSLNAWPNFVVTIAALLLTFFFAWRRGYSPLELVSKRMDRKFVETLRARFGNP